MISLLDFDVDTENQFGRDLRGYIEAVATAVGVGGKSTTLDLDVPVSAYIAIDWRLSRFPDRDLALVWDERHGWAAVVEASCGEELLVLSYLGREILPDPRHVVRFLASLRAGDHVLGQPLPPWFRRSGNHHELSARLAPFRLPKG